MSAFYTVEIPHQFPARVDPWPSKEDALNYHKTTWWESDTCGGEFEEEPQTEGEILDWAGYDLSLFMAFETLGELEEWARSYAHDPRAGGTGGHQSLKVLVQVEQLLEGEVKP